MAKLKKIDQYIEDCHRKGYFSGIVLISQNKNIVHSQSIGLANRVWNIPNRINYRFLIGSLTKQFTAYLVLKLVSMNILQLTTPISHYISFYRRDIGDSITIEDLLYHASGLPNHTDYPGFFYNIANNSVLTKNFINEYCSGNLEFKPGTETSYSNTGYWLLGVIIELVTGKSYGKLLQDLVFKPFKMKGSGFSLNHRIIKKLSSGYAFGLNGYEQSLFIHNSVPFSSGGIYSTAIDLNRWNQQMLINDQLPLMYRHKLFEQHQHGLFSYGWRIKQSESSKLEKIFYHLGEIHGYRSLIYRYPENEQYILLLSNYETSRLSFIHKDIELLLKSSNIKPTLPLMLPLLLKIYKKEGWKTAELNYWDISERYFLQDSDLYNLSQNLILKHDWKNAEDILKLNMRIFPKSEKNYLALGEMYWVQGKRSAAKQAYLHALKMNPSNKKLQVIQKYIEEKSL